MHKVLIKILGSVLTIVVLFTSIWVLQTKIGFVSQGTAAQCWEAGCCGFTLVYNQWSCQTNENSGLCALVGEVPQWTCTSTGKTYPSLFACEAEKSAGLCAGTCEQQCLGGWARQCVQTQGTVNCSNPDDNTCYGDVYAVQCTSLNGGRDCSSSNGTVDRRSCWVGGSSSPPPGGNPPPPPPSGCPDGTPWYTCTAGSCANSTPGVGTCGQCPSSCPVNYYAKTAVVFFEDVNNDGDWDYNAGERRISRNSTCTGNNTYSVPGVELYVDGNVVSQGCNIGNGEGDSTPTTTSWSCDLNSGTGWTNGGALPVDNSCVRVESVNCSRCDAQPDGVTYCVSDRAEGIVCDGNYDHCSGGNGYVKNGPLDIVKRQVGLHTFNVVVPSGWIRSNDDPYQFSVNFSNSDSSQVRCNAGLTAIGLVRDLNKSCGITSSAQSLSPPNQIGSSDSITLSAYGTSGSTTTVPTRLLIAKSDYTQWTNPPAGLIQLGPYSGRYYYLFRNSPIIANHGFETNSTSPWFANTGGGLSAFFTFVDGNTPPNGSRYVAAVGRNGDVDPYIQSEVIDMGEDVSGKTYTISFDIKSHSSATRLDNRTRIQRYPMGNGGWNAHIWLSNIQVQPYWTTVTRTATFPANSVYSDEVRILLYPPGYAENGGNYYQRIYIDNFKIERVADTNAFNCTTSSSVACNDTVTLTNLPTGNYKVHCDLPTDPQKVSGNPNCTFNGGTEACSGWDDAGALDNYSFSVTCSPACGQTAGCGTSDSGNPSSTPAIRVTPHNGSSTTLVASSTTNVQMQNVAAANHGRMTFNWDTPTSDALSDEYELYVWDRTWQASDINAVISASSGLAWGSCNADVCKYRINRNTSSSTHSQVHVAVPSATYRLRVGVRAVNTTCSAYTGSNQNSGWLQRNFNLVSTMSGYIYEYAGSCSATGLPTINLSSGDSTGAVSNRTQAVGITSAINSTGTVDTTSHNILNVPYSPSASWGDNAVTLAITNNNPESAYVCACNAVSGNPTTCQRTGRVSPSAGNHFYLAQYDLSNGPWWQIFNGLGYGGNGVNSLVPDSCAGEAGCTEYVSIKDTDTTEDSAGALLTQASGITAGESGFWAVDRDPDSNQPVATDVNFSAVNSEPEDYAYFAGQHDLTGTQLPADVSQRTQLTGGYTEDDGTRVYHRAGDLTISPGSGQQWSISNNEKIIIFVNGNLTFRDDGLSTEQFFNVPQSAYLGFIVSGNIIVDRSVGHDITDSNYATLTPNLTGVFVANNIIIESDNNPSTQDKKFVGEGTFVGWTGISLNRDFDDGAIARRFHNSSPTETFIYRPAFLENTPESMLSPGIVWQEIN